MKAYQPMQLFVCCAQLVDPTGLDDGDVGRLAGLRELESSVDHVVVMLEKSLSSTLPVAKYLMNSPFMSRWVQGQLDPTAPSRPTLNFVLSR